MTVKESYTEATVCEYIETFEDWYAVKLLKRRGWPDRLILGPGPTVYFIEFKRVGKDAEKLQRFVHKLLRKLGLKVYVCKTVKAGKKIFRRHFQAA